MRLLTVILIVLITNCSFSFNEGLFLDYHVQSDDYDSTLKEGFIRISGKVSLGDLPRANALISNGNSQEDVRSNSNGEYEITSKLNDSSFIFCYHPQAKAEIIFKNYPFISQHHIVIDFYLQSAKSIRPMKKPVIYMYSDEDIKCTVDIVPKGSLTFTYPVKDSVWKVCLTANQLPSIDNNQYPYLFWEGEGAIEYQYESGVLLGETIKTDSILNYFENKLTELGLNDQERIDFITFWTPQLLDKKYVFIQWLIDEEYDENIAELKVRPYPDRIRRIYLLASPLRDKSIQSIKQKTTSFERSGFTVVEWGGTIISLKPKPTTL